MAATEAGGLIQRLVSFLRQVCSKGVGGGLLSGPIPRSESAIHARSVPVADVPHSSGSSGVYQQPSGGQVRPLRRMTDVHCHDRSTLRLCMGCAALSTGRLSDATTCGVGVGAAFASRLFSVPKFLFDLCSQACRNDARPQSAIATSNPNVTKRLLLCSFEDLQMAGRHTPR